MGKKFIKHIIVFSFFIAIQSCSKQEDIPRQINGHWDLTVLTHDNEDILNKSNSMILLSGQMIFYKKNRFAIIHPFEKTHINGTIDFSLFEEKDSVVISNTDDVRLNGKYFISGGKESRQNGKFKKTYYTLRSNNVFIQIERNIVNLF